MKKPLALMAVLLMPALAQAQSSEAPSLEKVWETDGLRTPESVLYHEADGERYLLVSEIEGEGNKADGKGGIAKLSLDGEIIDQDWARGMNAPKGMAVLRNTLYVADLTEVLAVSLITGEILARIPVPDSVFLNDITIDDAGIVYVSDTRTNKVHRIENGSELFLEDIESPNGLKAIGEYLYIGAGTRLMRADAEGNLEVVAEGFAEVIDGVEPVGEDEFIVTCWSGLVYHVQDGELTELMDTRDPQMNTADLGWNPQDGMIYIPTFFTNSVIAYELGD